MPHPLLFLSQSDYLIQIFYINSPTEWQREQIQSSLLLNKPTDLDLLSFQREGISCFSRTKVNWQFLPDLWGQFFHAISSWQIIPWMFIRNRKYNTWNGSLYSLFCLPQFPDRSTYCLCCIYRKYWDIFTYHSGPSCSKLNEVVH